MKCKTIVMFSLLLLLMAGVAACSDEDGLQESISGRWKMIGYGNPNDWHQISRRLMRDNHFTVNFSDSKWFKGISMANSLEGPYKCKGSSLVYSEIMMTQLLYVGCFKTESEFFENHIIRANRIEVTDDHRLRLYYSDNDFFYFVRADEVLPQDEDIEPMILSDLIPQELYAADAEIGVQLPEWLKGLPSAMGDEAKGDRLYSFSWNDMTYYLYYDSGSDDTFNHVYHLDGSFYDGKLTQLSLSSNDIADIRKNSRYWRCVFIY